MDFWALLDLIGKQFPQFVPLLSEPGMWDIFSKAVDPATASQWSPARVLAEVGRTPWFTNQTAEERTWYVLDITDPATAARKKADAQIMVDRIAGSLGIPMNNYDKAILALHTAVNGWDEARIRMEIVAKTNGATTIGPGSIGDQMTQFNKLAGDYGVNVNHNDLYWWAANTQGGMVDPAGFRDYVTQQAMNLFPALTQPLSEGQTVADIANPYFAMASQELGIDPSQMSLLQPKWVDLFIGNDDKGNQGVLSQTEALRKIRSDAAYGYDKGLPGITQAASITTELGRLMGAIG